MNLKSDARPLIFIAVITFVIFANSLSGDFVYDDNRQILRNPLIQDSTLYGTALTSDVWAFKGDGTLAASNYYRPTFIAWLIINFLFFGTNPVGWHILNLLLHIAVGLLAYGLLRRWKLSTGVSFAVAAVFSVHPVHSESVAWIAGAPDPLFSLFLLGSLWFALSDAELRVSGKEQRFASLNLAFALILYALALGAKEIAMLCFPIFWLVFRFVKNDAADFSPIIRATPFALLALLFFGVRWLALGAITLPVDDGGATFYQSLLTAPSSFLFYLQKAFIPLGLGPNYPLRIVNEFSFAGFVVPLMISAGAAVLLLWLARRSAVALIGLALFLLPLLPALNSGSFPQEQIVHDRYLYLPILGLLMLIVPFLEDQIRKIIKERYEIVVLAGASLACVVLGALCVRQNTIWKNELALWSHAVKIDPNSTINWSQYASALSENQKIGEAVAAYNNSIDIRPTPGAYYGKARNLVALGKLDEAIFDLKTVIEMPNEKLNAYTLYQCYELLALALTKQSDFSDALRYLNEARRRLPIYQAALTEKLAIVHYQTNAKDSALRELESVRNQAKTELLPESKTVLLRLAMLYAETGRKIEAKAALQEYMIATASLRDNVTRRDRAQAVELLKSLQ